MLVYRLVDLNSYIVDRFGVLFDVLDLVLPILNEFSLIVDFHYSDFVLLRSVVLHFILHLILHLLFFDKAVLVLSQLSLEFWIVAFFVVVLHLNKFKIF